MNHLYRRPRVWALFYAHGTKQHMRPGDMLEQFTTIASARDELAIRFRIGKGHVTYSCGGKGTEHTVWPDHDRHNTYALVWLATGRDLHPGQAVDATSEPDEKWTPGPRGGVIRTAF